MMWLLTESQSQEISFGITNIDDEKISFFVTDTGIGIGIGINEDKLRVIFEMFSQADENVSKVYGGTGIGLSIVQ